MSEHAVVEQRLVVEGRPLLVSLLQNPTIEDVLITEAQVQAYGVETGDVTVAERRVSRDIRDFLIRLGVER